jgi:hypothetical protein
MPDIAPAQHSEYAAMMIDWVLLLAPLAALPVVLLLGFVGCTLPRTGDLPVAPIGLYLPVADVFEFESLEVNLQYTLDTGQSPPNLVASTKLTGPELGVFAANLGGLVPLTGILDLSGQPDGMLRCWCTVTLSDVMFGPTIQPEDWVTISPGNGDAAYFILFRKNGEFGLTGTTVPG